MIDCWDLALRPAFKLTPVVALLPYLVVLVALPLTPGAVGSALDPGLFFVLAAARRRWRSGSSSRRSACC